MSASFEDRFTDHYLEVNGLRLHYTDWGGSATTPVLMIHGLNVQLHTWDPIADRLRDEYRVFCLDLRGHGDSDWARDGYAIQSFISDIYEVAKKLDIVPFHYVGHSLGARIGIAYAGEHPETVRRLALSDCGPEAPRAGATQVRSIVGDTSVVRGFRNEDEALEYFRRQHPEWQPLFHDLHVKYQLRRNWAGKLVFKADPDLFWLNGSAALREVPYIWEMAARITAPTLIMWGERSFLLNQEIVDRMLAAIPTAELAKFDTGHYIPREQPDQFTQVLRQFLAG